MNIIERAFELSAEGLKLDETIRVLNREGFPNAAAHLAGKSIRADLTKRRRAV